MDSLLKNIVRFALRGAIFATSLCVAGCTEIGLVRPKLVAHNKCFTSAAYHASAFYRLLDEHSMYYSFIDEAGANTPDYWLLKRYKLAGFLANHPIYTDPQAVADSDEWVFTGTVYERFASAPEKILGGGRDYQFYEVRVDGNHFLVPLFLFSSPPFPLCRDS